MFVSIGTAAAILGVSITSLRRWEKDGSFSPCKRTVGGHRRYDSSRLLEKNQPPNLEPKTKPVLAYARVSSYGQLVDLETQKAKLESYCKIHFAQYSIISDLGSGLNYKKPGLRKLLKMIFCQEISHLVLNHRDRLIRFGAEIIFDLCAHFGVKVIIIEQEDSKSFEQELVADVIELMTVFSSKLYGRRSHQNRKAIAA